MDYRESHLQAGKGNSYHASFSDLPYRNMIWQMEKGILDDILKFFYRDKPIHYLDFACGTGRILNYLADRTTDSVGVDLSRSMLDVACQHNQNAEIYEADLTKEDVLGDRLFNLITAFRFFANAQPELRREALQVLSRHLEEDGCLVFNNHRNLGSTKFRLARLRGRGGDQGMSRAEVEEMTAETGLEIVKIYSMCILPVSDEHLLVPVSFLFPIESALSKVSPLHNLGENLIYVCRRRRNAVAQKNKGRRTEHVH